MRPGRFLFDILVVIEKDGSVYVRDNGRGIPIGIHPQAGVFRLRLRLPCCTQAESSADGYKVSGGLHGVGVSGCERAFERACGNGTQGRKSAPSGIFTRVAITKPDVTGDCEENGTEIRFLAGRGHF